MSRRSVVLSLVSILLLGTVAQAANIIWVSDNKHFGNIEPNVPVDQGWIDVLTAQGHNVIYKNHDEYVDGQQYWRTLDPNKIAELEAADLVILSRNADSGSYSTAADNEPNQWNAVTTPMISLSAHMSRVAPKWGWLNGGSTTYAKDAKLTVLDPTNPIFAGVTIDPNGQVDTFVTDWNIDYVKDVNSAGNGTLLAARASDGLVSIAYWDAGVEFFPGSGKVAGGPRLLFVAGAGSKAVPGSDGLYNLTLDGEIMFVNAVNYMLNKGKQIIFVSFHGADDAPAQKAADFGWTEATDKGYTDLLTANGYKVTRYITTGTPDAALLNAADLVIISRAAPSGNYQNAAATNWNTQITAPTMIMGGYIIRKNRMGYTTGNDMPDITGDIKLAVSDPNHPIFAGVAMTDGVMDNPYAGIAIYPLDPNIITRGISVNNNPANAEGTVLATIAPPADPNDPNDPNDTFDPITGPAGGMIIAEWPAGAVLTHDGGAGTDVLAGRRLVFLTGSREPDGITGGEAAGIYDLYDDGTKMFLNAVMYMLIEPSAVVE